MKMASRKFLITVYWLVFGAVCMALDYTPPTSLIMAMGLVSTIYIGGNVIQKFIVPTLGAINNKG